MQHGLCSPLGEISLTHDGERLQALGFTATPAPAPASAHPFAHFVGTRLRAYFAGDLQALRGVPLAPAATAFAARVRTALLALPPGETLSYGALAARIGAPTAVRAVARANARNPLALVVPCHRVVGKDGSLTGYAFGLARKRWLLAHERGNGV